MVTNGSTGEVTGLQGSRNPKYPFGGALQALRWTQGGVVPRTLVPEFPVILPRPPG